MKQMDNDEFAKAKKVLKALKDYSSENNRLSPKYEKWLELYSIIEKYEGRKKVGPPLQDSEHNFSKQMRFSDHLDLAFKNGFEAVSAVYDLVQDLEEDDWNYI